MKTLTVAAAALAAGMMTIAAWSQEAPAIANSQAGVQSAQPKSKAKREPMSAERAALLKRAAAAHIGRDAGSRAPIDVMTTAAIEPAASTATKARSAEQAPAKAKSAKAKTAKAPAKAKSAKATSAKAPAKAKAVAITPAKVKIIARPVATKTSKASAEKSETSVAVIGSGKSYDTIISRYASSYGVPVSLAHAVISIESNYRANARGRAGEIGLMQIKPATARMMGYSGSAKGLFSPETNIKYGMKYLAKARELGGGSTCRTILKYNAGHGAKRMNPVSAAYCSKVKRHLGG